MFFPEIIKAAIMAAGLLFASVALANHTSSLTGAEVDTILPAGSLQDVCEDSEPLNDGYGWNGMCTCRVPASFQNFGNAIVTEGNRLVIGSEESPNSCLASGSASVYQIQTDGSVVKEAELVSNSRQANDAFALLNKDLSLSGDYLAVGTTGTASDTIFDIDTVSVFRFDGETWNELYNRDTYGLATRPFSIVEDELFLITDQRELNRHKIDDGEVIQAFSISCPNQSGSPGVSGFDIIDDTLAIRTFGCGSTTQTRIFRQASTGEYLQEAVFDKSYALSQMPNGRTLLYGDTRTDNSWPIYSIFETTDGLWQTLPPLPFSSPRQYAVHEGQLAVIDSSSNDNGRVNFLRIYEISSTGNWVQKQRVEFHRESVTGGAIHRLSFHGNWLGVVRGSDSESADEETNSTVSLLEKDNANQWRLVFEEDFAGGQARHFSPSNFGAINLFLPLSNNEVKNIRFPQSDTGNIDCDYSNADVNDGWGWNPITLMSCAPGESETTGTCDYTDAALYDGWGWNSELAESCPPDTDNTDDVTPPAGSCDYSDAMANGGWGWNTETGESCPPTVRTDLECDYTDALLNGGWGWNATTQQSCAPSASVR